MLECLVALPHPPKSMLYRTPAHHPTLLLALCTPLAFGCPTPTPTCADSDNAKRTPPGVVAEWKGGQVSLDDLEDRLSDELRRMDMAYRWKRFETMYDALDGVLEEGLVDAEVARRELPSREALFAAEIDGKLPEPTEAALRAEFDSFVVQVPHATFEAAEPFLRKQLRVSARQHRHDAFIAELKQAAGVQIHFPFPDMPRVDVEVDDDDPVLGAPDAPVTIVQFGGFQCYYCKRVDEVMHRLVSNYDGKVRLVYKDFPLAGHTRATHAAVAAHCAGEQGKYWQMYDLLFANQGRLERDHLRGYAAALGLDLTAWQTCTDSGAWDTKVEQDIHAGREAGVTSTPTFFVNGLMISGSHPYDRFAALLEQELARVKNP